MLTDKIAVVTGASRGIGREIAVTLASKGAVVIVNYNGSTAKAEEVVKEIQAAGGRAEAVQCNVSDFSEAARLMEYVVKQYGRVDILVNNAGITRDNLLMKMSEEDFDAVLNTNLKGAFNCIKHISRQMLKQRSGRIINISSVSGVMGNAGQVNYSASKAGIIGITKSVAREMASRGITSNAVAPGFIDTDMTAVLPDAVKAAATEQIPMKRFGSTRDIASMVAFLASDEAGYITGQVICVDGGIGFAKNREQNLELLNGYEKLSSIGYPLLLGASRKSLFGGNAEDRLPQTVESSRKAAEKGVLFVRVHDVKENAQAIREVYGR